MTELEQIREALVECINDLEPEIENRYAGTKETYPSEARRYKRDIETVVNGKSALQLLDTLIAKEEKGWKLIKALDCGCEIRRSNKGNYFTDNCEECTNLPKELFEITRPSEREEKLVASLKEIIKESEDAGDMDSDQLIRLNLGNCYDIAESTLSELGLE